jgi:hypothetical protein
MSHRRAHRLVLGFCASAVVLVPACAGAGSERAVAVAELPTMSVQIGTGVEAPATATDLIRESYVVARGRFVGDPAVVQTSPDGEELAHSLVVWEFVPDEVYRDVRTADAPSRVAEDRRGSILVAASTNEVGRMRGAESVETFVGSFPSVYNLNSVPVDRPLYVFLSPGSMPRDAVARDADLAHVMILVGNAQCYAVDDLERSCAYVADTPGGTPEAVLAQGGLVPGDLSPEAIEAAGSVAEVVDSGYSTATAPIDAERYAAIPDGGGEG